jgi:putative ABC transport system ATP-binding protein
VEVAGIDLTSLSEEGRARFRRENVGVIFQQFHLLPFLTAVENVMVAQHYHSMPDEPEALAALERVGLKDRSRHLPSQLSGGEQQRVCVARALVNHPRLILADEPTGNLDADNEDRVLRLLRELHADGRTLVTVTHAPRVGHLADRRVELRHGQLTDLTVASEEIDRRYDEVLVQMWSLEEDGRVPEARRVRVPDVVDNRRTLLGMFESGLLFQPGDTLEFTPRGRARARDLVRRRRLAEVLFSSAMHLPEPEVELAACRMEHIIDPEVTNSICAFLGHPRLCPHGRAIPTGDCCDLPIVHG